MIFQFNEKQVFAVLALIFISVQVIGVFTAMQYMNFINAGEIQPVFQNPNDVSNSFILIFYILIMTGVLLLIIKYKKSLIRVLEAIAIFFASALVFDMLFPQFLGLGELLALGLTALKIFKPSYLTQNLALVFSVAGAGAVLGVSLGVTASIVLMLLLSVYDFISVFITKHMV
jgi:presenilin-like A22 family membrane protease